MKRRERSERHYRDACNVLVGGVNSPVRAFRDLPGPPLFIERGEGAYVWDADGNRYIDYVGSWGPLILGHAHPAVREALHRAVDLGTSFGAPTEHETRLARLVQEQLPSMERIRFVNSGTEATMSAVRLARGYTGRNRIVKFAGCYHGHVDALLVEAGSGALTLGVPTSPGIPETVAADTVVLPFNDLAAAEELFAAEGESIAAVILEPVAGNMGVIPPVDGFLAGLRDLTREHGALLIFDEVITGFRVAPGGAQERYGVIPDLTCLGKVIGGGLPVGAYGGRREVMAELAPEGPVYQAGTLSGNPLAMVAGHATISHLTTGDRFDRIERQAAALCEQLGQVLRENGLPYPIQRVGTVFSLFFTDGPVRSYDDATGADTALFRRYFEKMLAEGIYLAPSPFEAAFVSLAHGDEEREKTVSAFERSIEALLN